MCQIDARKQPKARRNKASGIGIHHFISQLGMGVRCPGSRSFVDVFLSASLALSCSSSAGTMVAPLLWFTASHRSSLSRELVPVMGARVTWVSSECSRGFLVSQFCSVKCDRRGRWMSPSGPTCQPSCWSALFGRGSGAHPQEYVGRVGLARRETRVKPARPALAARETFVKRQSCPLGRPPRPQQRNLAPLRNIPATPWRLPQTLPLPRSWV